MNRLAARLVSPGCVLAGLLMAAGLAAQEEVEVVDTPGNHTFTVPSGVTEITVEVWGAGGRGGSVTRGTRGAGGGGGGAFASSVLEVTAGQQLDLRVGAGSTDQAPGGDSWFDSATTVLAKGGASVPDDETDGGAGGTAAQSIGDVTFSGGSGADGDGGRNSDAGGGGSSAGNSAPGNDATGQPGATAPSGGGEGGDGNDQDAGDGAVGSQPGGGGGGARGFAGNPGMGGPSGGGTGTGGAGGDGKVVVRYTPQPPGLILEYRMEQSSWTGAAGEVLDTSDFDRHGTARDDADTDDEGPANVEDSGNAGTCRYGKFDGNSNGVDEPNAGSYLNGLSAITVMAWVYNTDGLSGNDRGIFFTNDPSSGKDHRLGIRYDTSGFNGRGNNIIKAGVQTTECSNSEDCVQVETESGVMIQNQWQHVAMTWESGGDLRVYVDGTDVTGDGIGEEGQGTGGTIDAVNALNIAQGAKGDRWQGRIDEFRIFNGALSQSEIQQWKDTTAPCEVLLPDHIRLLHPGSGLTCQPADITVQACAEPDCSTLFDEEVTVTFTSPAENWAPNPVTFTGQTNAALQVTTPRFVTLDAAADPPANNPARCFVGNTETCQMEWLDTGFVIDAPNHVSATEPTGTVAAVRTDNENQTCAAAFGNESREVGFWSNYLNPSTGTLPMAVNGIAISESPPGTGVILDFDANGVAPIELLYGDVGSVLLNARFEGSGDEAGLVLTGQDSFISRPATFTLDIPGNPAATNSSGPVFGTAGSTFEINAQSRNAVGNITPNFGQETTSEGVSLDTDLIAPTDGNIPGLVGGFGDFGEDCEGNSSTDGTGCGAFAWPEVGIIAITPRLASGAYLGTADVVGDETGPVGRFIPSHFNLSAGALSDRVELDDCDTEFTYIGELFGADWTLDARNAGGVTTANYEGAFAKLGADALGIDADENITIDSASIAWAGGFGTAMAEIRADRSAPAGPFEDFQVGTAPVDADGVELNNFDIDLSGNGNDDHGLVGTTELRFGRLVVDNAVGSELGPLVLPLRAESFEDETWKINTLDDCTAISLVDDVELTSSNGGDPVDGTMPVDVGSGSTSIEEEDPVTLTDGTAAFTFSAPDDTGWVDLELLLDMDWHFLRDDLDDDDNFLENPSARASFGLFEGDENRILLQEIAPGGN